MKQSKAQDLFSVFMVFTWAMYTCGKQFLAHQLINQSLKRLYQAVNYEQGVFFLLAFV